MPFYYDVNFYQIEHSPLTIMLSGIFVILILLLAFYFLNKNRKFFEMLMDKSLAAVYIVCENKICYINQRGADIFGYTIDEMIGMDVAHLYPKSEVQRMENSIKKLLDNNVHIVQEEYMCLKKDGSLIHIEINGALTSYNGHPAIIGTANDITIQKNMSNVISYFDPIYKLPNERMLQELVKSHINSHNEKPVSLVLIRLNRLSAIQEAYGFDVGDLFVNHFIDRVKSLIDKDDIVSRYNERKLAVCLFNASKDEAAQFAEKMVEIFKTPYRLEHFYIMETVNIGISTYPELRTIERLASSANIALRASLDNGPNHIQMFDESMLQSMVEKVGLERDLNYALDNGEFCVYYQPKIDLATGKISGLEALLRWKHPEIGLVSPAVFIPIAEKSGLIIPITKWVFHTVCRELKEWDNALQTSISVAINISPLHFLQPDFINNVEKLIEKTGVDPSRIELEITENQAINIDLAAVKLQRLKELGFKISLDDFGSGYSSLGKLNRLPLDKIKIDQSFMKHQFSDPANRTIVSTIIAMADSLMCTVVAEGVETMEQLSFLKEHGCEEGQGFFFSKPLPLEELLEDWLLIENRIFETENRMPEAVIG